MTTNRTSDMRVGRRAYAECTGWLVHKDEPVLCIFTIPLEHVDRKWLVSYLRCWSRIDRWRALGTRDKTIGRLMSGKLLPSRRRVLQGVPIRKYEVAPSVGRELALSVNQRPNI